MILEKAVSTCDQMTFWELNPQFCAGEKDKTIPLAIFVPSPLQDPGDIFDRDGVIRKLSAELQMCRGLLEMSQAQEVRTLCKYKDLLFAKEEEIKQIRALAFNDPLTGLYNANYLDRKLRKALRAVCEKGETNHYIGITVVDVNYLKTVNDRFGHYQGNELIKHFATVLRALKTPWDIIARIGGDEFILISIRKRLSELKKYSHLLRTELRAQCLVVGDRLLRVSASVGSAYANLNGAFSFNGTFIRADKRMYAAKKRKVKPEWLK